MQDIKTSQFSETQYILHLRNSKFDIGFYVVSFYRGVLTLEDAADIQIGAEEMFKLLEGCFKNQSTIEFNLEQLHYLTSGEHLKAVVYISDKYSEPLYLTRSEHNFKRLYALYLWRQERSLGSLLNLIWTLATSRG